MFQVYQHNFNRFGIMSKIFSTKNMLKHIVWLCFLLTAFFLTQGCSELNRLKNFKETSDPYPDDTYIVKLKKWTKEARIYRGFDLELIVNATFKNADFRNAYSNEYARAYKLSNAEKKKLINDQNNAAYEYNDFILAAYVPEEKWNDFDNKNSIWKVYLSTNELKWIRPIEIRKIKKDLAVMQHFFPYITPWKMIYMVRFPAKKAETNQSIINHNTGKIKLIVTGVRGTTQMVWKSQH